MFWNFDKCRPEVAGEIIGTTNASSLKILHEIALDSLNISTGNDVTSYCRSAENRINVFILGQVRVEISR